MKIAENLYVYFWRNPQENNCNSVFIDGKVPALIDPGHSHRVSNLMDRMRQDGLDPKKIQVIICTHSHPDHFTGTMALRDMSVKVAISKEEEKFIEDIGKPAYRKQGLQTPDYKVDFYLKEGQLLLGKHEFEILLTPGHTPGSLTIYWPRYKLLIPGDVVFAKGVGRVDLPGGDEKALKNSVALLSGLPVELIIPGHGTAVQGEKNVKMNFEFIKKAFLGAG